MVQHDANCEIRWGGQTFRLRPDRGLYWVERQSLIVADPHFGKADYFRGAGIPVPAGTTKTNLDRLDIAINQTSAKRLLVLGDFFHSRDGVTPGLLAQITSWRQRHPELEVFNVRGNHDKQAGDPPDALGIQCVPGPWRDEAAPGLALAHEPCLLDDAVVLCGHIHPAVTLEGLGKARMRVACFHFAARQATLPAFGAFTGMKAIRPRRNDRVFAVGPDRVVEVSRPSNTSRSSRSCVSADTIE